MDAVVALCHFCEVHGPSIVLTTQPFHTSTPNGVPGTAAHGPWGLGSRETPDSSPTGPFSHPWFGDDKSPLSLETGSSGSRESPRPLSPLEGGGGGRGAEVAEMGKRPNISSIGAGATPKSDSCEACKAFQTSHQVFYSHDEASRITFVSSHAPENPKIFSMLRQACVRSLSCEVCPGREGPIYFGQDNNQGSHTLSHTFYVKDSLARGFKRFYSIIVLMSDKMFLLNSWQFLVDNIKAIISKIQQSAFIIFNMEENENPQRGLRLTQSLIRGGVAPRSSRPLTDLLANKLIYKILHMQFTWLLRVGGKRLRERILEGTPLQETIASMELERLSDDDDDDGLVDIARDFDKLISADVGEEMTEEGFVRVDIALDETERVIAPDMRDSTISENAEQPTSPFLTPASFQAASLHGMKDIRGGKLLNPFLTSAAGDNEDVEIPETSNGTADEDLVDIKLFSHIRDIIKIVGEDKFHIIAHHILVGNQVIVQGQPRHLVTGLVEVLQTILPRGCVKSIPYSSVYEDSWRCNFIGLPPDVSLPEYVVDSSANHFLWLGVAASSNRVSFESSDSDSLDGIMFPFVGTEIEVDILKSDDLPNKVPEILRRMELALFNTSLTNAMVDQCLLCLREEWMNKVKVFFTFTRAGTPSSGETERLLRVLGAEAQDQEVLKFWMTGLSTQCKQHIFSLKSGSS